MEYRTGSWTGRLRLREAMSVANGHTAGGWGSQHLTHTCLILCLGFWTSALSCFPSGTRGSQLAGRSPRGRADWPHTAAAKGQWPPWDLSDLTHLGQPIEHVEARRKRGTGRSAGPRGLGIQGPAPSFRALPWASPPLAHLPLAFHFVPATPFQAFFFPLDRRTD